MARKARGDSPTPRTKQTAESMSAKQRDIAVSEFFAKNRHLLGFDNPRKALLTTVKEAVDNSLDACEEAGILPDITVKIEEVQAPPSATKPGRYRVTIMDNGPGIVRKQVEHIFGRLLYGSKFHRLKMSRGQQGIGISAAGMYGLMTTGKPMEILTRPDRRKPAHRMVLAMDTTKNRPEVTVDEETNDFYETSNGTGTSVTITLEARYFRGKSSVDEYLELTAIANPHATFTFFPPRRGGESVNDAEADDGLLPGGNNSSADATARGKAGAKPGATPDTSPADTAASPVEQAALAARTVELDDRVIYPRAVHELPPETQEIKPHPYGVELGMFLQKLKGTEERQLAGFFGNEFCRVPPAVVTEICDAVSSAKGDGAQKVTGSTLVRTVTPQTGERLWKALQETKLRAPPTDCLAPIGVRTMLAGLLKGVKAEFYAASTREPAVYRGNPFQIEAAIAFGGTLPADDSARVIRFANRVPLQYQQSACCAFKSVIDTGWKNYGLAQPRGTLPVGPLVVMIHMASVWVPFTSESKEAIAEYDDIKKEMKLALMECGRKLGTYVRRRQKMKREHERRDVFERYIGEISRACNAITGVDAAQIYAALKRQAERRTELADAILDDEGKVIGSKLEQLAENNGRLDDDDGVIILATDDEPATATRATAARATGAAIAPPAPQSPAQSPPAAPAITSGTGTTTKVVKKVLKKVLKKVAKKKAASRAAGGLFGDD